MVSDIADVVGLRFKGTHKKMQALFRMGLFDKRYRARQTVGGLRTEWKARTAGQDN